MRSALPKVLHQVAGRPLIDHVLDLALFQAEAAQVVVVIGHGAEQVSRLVTSRGVRTALQEPQLGTGDAIRVALASAREVSADAVLVLSGDVPLLRPQTITALTAALTQGATASVLSAVLESPGQYGRIVRDSGCCLREIVEARDADPDTLAIREVNAGVYAFSRVQLEHALAELTPENDQGEYYLTDLVAILGRQNHRVAAVTVDDRDEMLGINTRQQLARAAAVLNQRKLEALMDGGVTVIDPRTTWVEPGCRIEADVLLEPGVVLRGGTSIATGAQIGAGSVLEGATIRAGELVPPLSHRCSGPPEA